MPSMADQPVRCLTPTDYGGDGRGARERSEVKIEAKEEEEGSPSIKLGLGIDGKTSEKEKPVMCVFTAAQFHELQLQARIFEHIKSRIPVPLHLVMPIWKNIASSFDSARGGIYEQYPSFVGISPQGFDNHKRNMLDPEGERCRRTDGKKWRCSKSVIPDQKYCEQHMHRGRQRSRKPVESSQITLPDTTLSKYSNKESENSNNPPAPVSFRYMNQSCCSSSPSQETIAMDSSKRNTISTNAATGTTIIPVTNNHKKNDCKRSKNFPSTTDKGEEKLSISDNNVTQKISQSRNNAAAGNSASPGVGFSPKSVLQVPGCSTSSVYRTEIELEPGRCRRTDGKKWRCRRDVIPDQKYCARHMHRGAKKHVEVSRSVATTTVADCPSGRFKMPNKVACAAVTTSLSISVPSHHLITHDEKSMSSSSETTISDTTINVFDNGNFP